MNKTELTDILSDKTGIHKQDVKNIINAYTEVAIDCIRKNEIITISGFGSLYPKNQTSRMARNPKTGEPVIFNARKTAKFKPSKFLLKAINE